jgi:uncharacterized protein (DUF1778 family)
VKAKRKSTESGRFEARVSLKRKSFWQRAADIRGNSLTEFVVNSADAAAERTIKEAEFMELTQRDRVSFVQALLNVSAPPNAKLRGAARRHTQLFPVS